MAKTSSEYKELSIKEFTKAAAKYETANAGVYNTCKQDYPEIIEFLKTYEFTTLLDAGCGTAPLITMLSDVFPDKQYVGIDITPAMIDKAKEKHLPNAYFVVGDCEHLPFENNSFDVIVCSESFHHYPNPQDFFNSVYRCLKKDGILFLRDYAADGLLAKCVNNLMMPLINLIGHGDVRVCSETQLRHMCTQAGLKVEKFEHIKGISHKMNLIAVK